MSSPTTPALPINPAFGPVRRAVIRVLTVLFVISLVAMLGLGTVLVVLQLAGVLIANGQFVIDVEKALGPWTYGVAAGFGTLTLLVALAYGWKSND